jgi:aromatic-L-amino-acid/L-tryptophan decarboxylase
VDVARDALGLVGLRWVGANCKAGRGGVGGEAVDVQRSEVGHVGAHLARIGAELDRFLEFREGDPVARREEWTASLLRPLPERGIGAQAVIDEIADTLIPNGARLAEPGFSSWITTGPDTVPVVAAAAASIAAPQRYWITAFNLLEELSLTWLAELCGLGGRMQGVYSSGGSVANLVALGAARQWALEQAGIDAAADGMGETEVAVYASTEAHHTVQRSAAVLGIGRSRVRLIATDDRQRMRVDVLRRAVEDDVSAGVLPIAVVATAGTTNTGAIDPVRGAGEVAHEHGAWLHVDGAYGLLGLLDDRVAALYDGLELADSAIIDPHKWLGTPVGISATFVRDRSILHRAFTQEPAAYLEGAFDAAGDVHMSLDSMGIPYSEFAVELGAPSRGAVVWSVIRELGREGVRARIRRDNDLARRLAEHVQRHPRLELITEPVLSICCFRYTANAIADLNAFNTALLRRLVRETPYLPSSTIVEGTFVIRPCYINARTHDEHIDGLIDAVVALGDDMFGAS